MRELAPWGTEPLCTKLLLFMEAALHLETRTIHSTSKDGVQGGSGIGWSLMDSLFWVLMAQASASGSDLSQLYICVTARDLFECCLFSPHLYVCKDRGPVCLFTQNHVPSVHHGAQLWEMLKDFCE